MTLGDDTVIERRHDLLWRAAPGYLVVATVDDELHEASGPAPAIWEAIATPIRFGDLVARLAATYGAPADNIRKDVSAFVTELLGLELVVTHG